MSPATGYRPRSLSELLKETGCDGVLPSARLIDMEGSKPTLAFAYPPMIADEAGSLGNESTLEFQTLLSGKIGQPPMVRTFVNVFGFCCPATTHEKRLIASRVQTLRRSGCPLSPRLTITLARVALLQAGSLPAG